MSRTFRVSASFLFSNSEMGIKFSAFYKLIYNLLAIMMTPPVVKRRRLNNPNINKPFRSPFRNASQVDGPGCASSVPTAPDCAQQSPAEISQNSESSPSPAMSTKSQPTPGTPVAESAKAPNTTPESRRVTSSIIATRATISTLQQALKILEDPDRSEQLAALSEKWRGAARLAADAVYAGARDKVNRAGGVGAWRESERERAEWRRSWNEAEPRQGVVSDAANEADEDGDSGRDASEVGQGRGYWDGVHDDDVCASYRS
jgi:Swi5-dependent recombination DNA repair protein 1